MHGDADVFLKHGVVMAASANRANVGCKHAQSQAKRPIISSFREKNVSLSLEIMAALLGKIESSNLER
jgi:hypothetical protein